MPNWADDEGRCWYRGVAIPHPPVGKATKGCRCLYCSDQRSTRLPRQPSVSEPVASSPIEPEVQYDDPDFWADGPKSEATRASHKRRESERTCMSRENILDLSMDAFITGRLLQKEPDDE